MRNRNPLPALYLLFTRSLPAPKNHSNLSSLPH
jgi:hypothetical protein